MLSSEEMMDIRDDAIRMLEDGGFVQKVSAVDANGEEVSPTDPDAERFCLMGAVGAAVHEKVGSLEEHAVVTHAFIDLWCEANSKRKSMRWPVGFNDADGRTADEVIYSLRKIINLTKERA